MCTIGIIIILKYIFPRFVMRKINQNSHKMQETWEIYIQSLGWEDPLEKEMATHSSILAWKIPWTEDLGRLQFMGLQEVSHD